MGRPDMIHLALACLNPQSRSLMSQWAEFAQENTRQSEHESPGGLARVRLVVGGCALVVPGWLGVLWDDADDGLDVIDKWLETATGRLPKAGFVLGAALESPVDPLLAARGWIRWPGAMTGDEGYSFSTDDLDRCRQAAGAIPRAQTGVEAAMSLAVDACPAAAAVVGAAGRRRALARRLDRVDPNVRRTPRM